jgi:uncharacterized membrane-anchored protein YjiN (DUF445 family)
MNMSSATNLISLALIGIGYLVPPYQKAISSVGYFAFSGAITNWLAIYMLFEKVPGLYGSGVIPNQFEDFKRGIKNMMMTQFFTQENIAKFFSQQKPSTSLSSHEFEPVIAAIDLDKAFQGLVQVVLASPLGGMLAMFGGPQALQPMKDPFKAKMRETLIELSQSEDFQGTVARHFGTPDTALLISDKVSDIVDQRLAELTPRMVKEIIEDMIQKHLGWLVVWGGVLGGLIGLIMAMFE